MRALIVHNENAGTGQLGRDELVRRVAAAGCSVSYQAKPDLDLCSEAAREADIIVVAGGDGTVASVLTRLPSREKLVVIVPSGTANNVARSVGIDTLERGADLPLVGKRHKFDIFEAQWAGRRERFVEGLGFGPFLTMIEAGAGAKAANKMAAGREALAQAVATAEVLPISIEAEGEPIGSEALLLEVLNVGLAGPNVWLAPAADPGDGWLDIVWLRPENREAMLAWFVDPLRERNPLDHHRARRATIRGAGRFRIDDKCCDLARDDVLTIEPDNGPVEILIPERRLARGAR